MNPSAFDAERARLTAIATRIVGSAADADDVVQEARIRFVATDDVENAQAWLTTVVTRLCLDHLRRSKTRADAEEATFTEPEPIDPEADALLAERVGGAMHVVLDTLAPAERAAFVLHDVFGYPFDEISAILGRSTTAVRQLASRARRKVHGAPEPASERRSRDQDEVVLRAFLAAARGGDLATLLSLLAPDAVMRADLIGQQMGSEPVYEGAAAVAGRLDGAKGAMPALIDGVLGAAWIAGHDVKVAFVFHLDDGLVREVELIADPYVLTTLDVVRLRADDHTPPLNQGDPR